MSRAVRRRRLLAGAAALAVLAAIAGLLVARATGGGPPEDSLAELVPGTALAYVHASTDPDRDADRRLVARLERLPGLRALGTAALARVGGTSRGFSFARDIRPWLGDEAAIALLPSPRGARADALVLAA
ncbi:MAG TPA: DUF3352 domain-containing protein, partial [Solirubrobacteraceae bacterium]